MHERAIARAVLQPDRIEAMVEHTHVCRALASVDSDRRVLDALPTVVNVDCERARTVHMELGHRVFEVAILQALGHCRILQGRVKEGTTMIEEALTLCEQVRGQATQVVGLLNLGLQRFCNKEYAMAQESFARALDIAESLHSLRLQAAVLANWGSLYTRVGELDKANALFEQMLSLVEGKDRTLTSQGLSLMAVLHALRGEEKKAQETMTAALELYDFREGLDWLGVMLRKVEVEHRVGRTEAAKASLAEAREAVDSTEVRPGAPLVEELQRIEAIVGGRRSTVP